jgi:AcrR family transcriptional regulator
MAIRRSAALRESAEEYAAKRAQILVAAAKIFKEKGYAATSINDIAQASGVDRATLYYYVSKKQELFELVIRKPFLENVRFAESIANSQVSPTEKIRQFTIGLMNSFTSNYPDLYVYMQENLLQVTRDSEIAAMGRRFEAAITLIIQSGLKDGSFSIAAPPTMLMYALLGMLNWTHRWFKPTGKYASDEIGAIFADLVLGGLVRGALPRELDVRPIGIRRAD